MSDHPELTDVIVASDFADGLCYTIAVLRDDQLDLIAERVIALLREQAAG